MKLEARRLASSEERERVGLRSVRYYFYFYYYFRDSGRTKSLVGCKNGLMGLDLILSKGKNVIITS